MPDHYIGVHLRTSDAPAVRRALADTFAAHGFTALADTPAAEVAADDDALPPGGDWYGTVVSGRGGRGWVSVYIEDWQDSGLLARALAVALGTEALEIWVAGDVHWGYTLFDTSGTVADRFADAPAEVADTPAEAELYAGRADAFPAALVPDPGALQAALQAAHEAAGTFAGPGVDALAAAVGLPFEHVFTGYEFFFADDPEDYGPSLEHWPAFRHLAFQMPPGRETLAD